MKRFASISLFVFLLIFSTSGSNLFAQKADTVTVITQLPGADNSDALSGRYRQVPARWAEWRIGAGDDDSWNSTPCNIDIQKNKFAALSVEDILCSIISFDMLPK